MLVICSFFPASQFSTVVGLTSALIQAGEKAPLDVDNLVSGAFYKGDSFEQM